MAKRQPIPCAMCKKRQARKLTAQTRDTVYVNGKNVQAFCSVRCAANWALVWHPTIYQWDAETGEWEDC